MVVTFVYTSHLTKNPVPYDQLKPINEYWVGALLKRNPPPGQGREGTYRPHILLLDLDSHVDIFQ